MASLRSPPFGTYCSPPARTPIPLGFLFFPFFFWGKVVGRGTGAKGKGWCGMARVAIPDRTQKTVII
ncbi:MAG: hypothetical protein KF704_02180 [Crocinitomicaceae bacterium]|nr:hypothetical protein [Crocinitomicaceae bacterium]